MLHFSHLLGNLHAVSHHWDPNLTSRSQFNSKCCTAVPLLKIKCFWTLTDFAITKLHNLLALSGLLFGLCSCKPLAHLTKVSLKRNCMMHLRSFLEHPCYNLELNDCFVYCLLIACRQLALTFLLPLIHRWFVQIN